MRTIEGARTAAGRRVLAAASELFYTHGIHAVGVAAIAAAAGVTKKTLYDCYGSKDQLVAAYLQHRDDTWWASLERRLAAATVPRTLAVFDAYADESLDTSRGCAFLNGAAELPAGHPGYAIVRAHKSAVRARLAELVAEDHPHIVDRDRCVEHLFLLLEGAIAHRGIDGDGHHLARARQIAHTMLGG
ncbi:MAG: TetR/AcrR family transcriptional regulator [Streptosporangiaceae bacterium]